MSVEKALEQGIPTSVAAAYFISVKTAGHLPPQEDIPIIQESFKRANALMGGMQPPPPAQLPGAALGKHNLQIPSAPDPTAKMAMPSEKSDKTPSEVGKERAHASLAAEFEKQRHHGRENLGDYTGRIGGLLAGGAAAHKMGKGKALSTIAGAALGQHVGGRLGRNVGAAGDLSAWERREKAASAFKVALEQADIQPQLDPATAAYVQNEQTATALEEQGQVEHLRAELDQTKQLAAQVGEQNAQLQQTAQMAQANVDQASLQAQQATDRVLQEQQASAAMRLALQQMRGQLLELASQDPPGMSGAMAAQATAQTLNTPAQQPPGAAPGEAGPESGGNASGEAPGPNATAQATQVRGQKEAAVSATPFSLRSLSRKRSGQRQ